jgi:hypothetical protein
VSKVARFGWECRVQGAGAAKAPRGPGGQGPRAHRGAKIKNCLSFSCKYYRTQLTVGHTATAAARAEDEQ